jgi:hypothetical protein
MRRLTSLPAATAALLSLAGGCSGPITLEEASTFPPRGTPAASPVGQPPCFDWRLARVGHPIDPLLGNPFPSREQPIGCAVDVNLIRQLAYPNDALPGAGGRVMGPASSRASAGAVERYHDDKVKPLPDRTSIMTGD